MNLSDYKESFYTFSASASSSARQLAMAGIAMLWVFKVSSGEANYTLPSQLFLPAVFLICALASDLLQYLIATVTWGMFHRYHEKKAADNDNPILKAPVYLSAPIYLFFYLKILFVLVAYSLMLRFAGSEITFQ